ncbi:MAG: hypothetical protein WKG03_13515, partial [Telluria sp.]
PPPGGGGQNDPAPSRMIYWSHRQKISVIEKVEISFFGLPSCVLFSSLWHTRETNSVQGEPLIGLFSSLMRPSQAA